MLSRKLKPFDWSKLSYDLNEPIRKFKFHCVNLHNKYLYWIGLVSLEWMLRHSRPVPLFLSEHTLFNQINFSKNILKVDGRERSYLESTVRLCFEVEGRSLLGL